MKKLILILSLASCLALLTACDSVKRDNPEPMTTVSQVNIERFLGEWLVAARTPAFFQKDCINSKAIYSATNKANTVEVLNVCDDKDKPGKVIEARGEARAIDPSFSKLKVKLDRFPGNLFEGNYWIIKLDEENYDWAIVSEPEGRYLWVMYRDQKMTSKLLTQLIDWLEKDGWDTDTFIYE